MRSNINGNSYFFRHKASKVNYKLSILTPTLNSRSNSLKSLWDNLLYQVQSRPVQLLSLGDNKTMTVGEKRNALLTASSGDYFCFVDDDDTISDDYVSLILDAISLKPDVITFNGTQNTDGAKDCPFTYDKNAGRNHKAVNNGTRWKIMIPDHLCVWSRSLNIELFPHKNISEDHEWAQKMIHNYSSVHHIDSFLYHYEFSKLHSECRR